MRRALLVTGLIGLLAPLASAGEVPGPNATDELITRGVLEMIRDKHLLKREIDNRMALRALDAFVKELDPYKQYFLKSDIDEFNHGKATLAEKLKKGDVSLAFAVYRRYQQRVAEAMKVWRELLGPKARHDFTADEMYILNPDALDYPKSPSEASERLRMTAKYNLLAMKTDPENKTFNLAEACQKLLRGYERAARDADRTRSDLVLERFLNHVCQQYDRLTLYRSAATAEEHASQIRGGFVGIGAVLQSDDGQAVVQVYPGSPADTDGHLKPKDRIVSVGQGKAGEMVDITLLTQKEAIALIRGKPGTVARLGVVHPGEREPKFVSVRRGRVTLPDTKVKDLVFQSGRKANGSPYEIGYIELPNFYKDASAGNSTTQDVRKRLDAFTSRGVDVVVLDMRYCSGGLLSEAISLAGLFVDQGPVMQYKDGTGRVSNLHNNFTKMAWNKGLVVLTSKYTGSGAEFVCGALQDYNRGLLVGDESTFGAGTVQQLFPVADHVLKINSAPDLGTLQVTSAQFYRVNGDSTQKRGVLADMVLPSQAGAAREQSNQATSSIGFDRVGAVSVRSFDMVSRSVLSGLRGKSSLRRKRSAEFDQLQRRIDWSHDQRRQLIVSLNETKYRTQQKENEAPPLPKATADQSDYFLKEVAAIAADYAGELGSKTATLPPQVAIAPVTPKPTPRPVAPTPTQPMPKPLPVRTVPTPAPSKTTSAYLPSKASQRRNIEIQLLEVERSIERDRENMLKYEREAQSWEQDIQKGNRVMRSADTNTKRFLVGAAQGFALSQKIEAMRNKRLSESSWNANRDRRVRLLQEQIRLRD